MSEFTYEKKFEVRFGDLDPMGHVNNVAYAEYLEHARVRYVEEVIGEEFLETGAVVANLNMDYRRPIEFGESVTVAVRATDLGESSIPLEYEIRVGDEVCATAETLMVTFDSSTQTATPMPDSWRERISEYERL